uniref:NR LBD domain-containing protein n=2 Tax=Panagrellus redivivus TaxID=6233 RepID=A0A7E4W6H9_PANRE
MKPIYLLPLLLLFSFPALHDGVAITGLLRAITVAADIASISMFIVDLFMLKKENARSELATETLYRLGRAFEEYEVNFENRMNENHITDNLQLFQLTVGFPAHNLFMTADKYLKSQTDFMEQLLISECVENEPYTHLNNLHTMIADKWFLIQAEKENYRLPDVEDIRIRILHSMKELVFCHFICMAVQGEPVEETVLTDVIRASVSNITDTIDKELKIIETLIFPKYVVKEVYKLIKETAFPNDELERRSKMAVITLQMLKNLFGPGIIVNSQNQLLFNKDYNVQVSKSPTLGRMPENAIVDIKINDDFILVTRANVFSLNANFKAGRTIFNSHCELNKYISEFHEDYDVFGVTVFTDGFHHPVRVPEKNDRPLSCTYCSCPFSMCCRKQSAVITSVPKRSLIDVVPQHSISTALENKRQMRYIRDIRLAVRAEITAIRESRKTTTTTMATTTTVTTTTSFVATTVSSTDVPLNASDIDATPEAIESILLEQQLKFLQDIREAVKYELKAAAVENAGSSSVSELITFVVMINFWIATFLNTL